VGTGAPSGTVTFLFTDIEGSTRLWEEHPEAMSEALRRHDDLMRAAIESAGGYVFHTVGDAFCAVFHTAGEAIAAAEAAQRALGVEPWPQGAGLRVRMALHTGECEERDGDYFGPAVNRVARLEATAHGGQVVLSRATADVVGDRLPPGTGLRDLGTHHLEDLGRPEQVFQLAVEGSDTAFPPLRSLDNPQLLHNLPVQVSSFVGRETEVIEVHKLVQASRLVTLTGVGGSGKTRLALQVAAESLHDFAEGVWLVELASLADPSLVAPAVASALRVREEPGQPLLETLVDALSDRRLLVVLDNCEHVLVASATLADTLLRSCRGLRILATSREPLGVTGEHVYRVPSLSLPEPGQILHPEQALGFDAVHLFVERAVARDSTFHLSVDNAATVVSLCRELDGMPLAIELAAARVASLSIEEIERRLADRFSLLTVSDNAALPRHQTLRALIDWSYDLLDEQEQAALCRLSTFVGGWTLEAAEEVCPQPGATASNVVDVLGSLVDKSLVQVDPAPKGGRRYRLLETIRHYCAEQFSQLAQLEQASTHLAHAVFFLGLAEEAAPHLRASERAQWFERIGLELGNLRVAMAHFASDPTSIDQALRIWIALEDFWSWGYHSPGIEELEAVLPNANDEPLRGLRARALWAVARLRVDQGDYAIAQAQFGEAFEAGKSISDRALMAQALGGLSVVALRQGNVTTAFDLAQEAVELAMACGDLSVIASQLNHRGAAKSACSDSTDRFDFEESLARFREVDDRFGIGSVLQSLAIRELKDGNLVAARARTNESLDLSREMADPSYGALILLGLVELLDGNAPAASRAYRELLAIARRGGFKTASGYALLGLGFCATSADDPRRAAKLHGAADALFETLGEALDPDLLNFRNGDHRQLRRIMGDTAFEADYRSGRNLAPQSVIDLAMQEPNSA
jgi:predicted ATPase/class 3 adenylate cyclase